MPMRKLMFDASIFTHGSPHARKHYRILMECLGARSADITRLYFHFRTNMVISPLVAADYDGFLSMPPLEILP